MQAYGQDPTRHFLRRSMTLEPKFFQRRNNGMAPIVVKGKIKGGNIHIDGSISSQFISALLIACPFARNDTTIMIDGVLKSRPYVNITIDMLKDAGANIIVDEKENSFTVPGARNMTSGHTMFRAISHPHHT